MNSFTKLIKSQPNEISDILKKLIKLETSDKILKNRLIKIESISTKLETISTELETEIFSTVNQLKGEINISKDNILMAIRTLNC